MTAKKAQTDAPGDHVHRYTLLANADLSEGENRFYMLQADKPLLGYNAVGPVAEAEPSPMVDGRT